MKKIFNTLSILLLLQAASYAQQPAGRTTETKIADVLAQQPAEEQSKFLLAMHELENFSSEDIAELVAKLRKQGTQTNSTIEFATNAYALYVMQPGKEAFRAKYVRSEEHTSELQSRENLVCRLLLEKKKTSTNHSYHTT